jgi:paraquat-inducible protein B
MTAGRQAAVGAFVLGGTALAFGAVVLFGNFSLFNPAVRAAVVFQDSVNGLSVGASVTFRGVRVGAVESITLQFDPRTRVAVIPVTVQLQPSQVQVRTEGKAPLVDLSQLVARGLRAELHTQSFVTGQSEIDLDFDPASPAVLHAGATDLPEIPTRLSSLQRARDQISQLPLRELVDNASATLQSLRSLSEKLDSALPPLVESLKSTSDRSALAADAAAAAIQHMEAQLDVALGDVGKLTATADRQLGQRGADLHTLLASANQAVLQAHAWMADLQTLTAARAPARVNIESALRDFATAAASLRGLANDVEHSPQLLLTGRRP